METEHPTKLDRLMHAVAEHHPLQAATTFAIHDFGVRFESNSPRVIAAMRDHFAPFLRDIGRCDLRVVAIEASPPELGLTFQEWPREPRSARDRGDEYVDIAGGRVVRKRESGLQFLLGPDMSLAVGACSSHPHQLIDLVNARFMEHLVQRGWLACSAAGVAIGDQGIAVCGAAGVGKTSLALRLVERGAALLSSDRLLIDAAAGGARIVGVPSPVRVNPGTLLATPRLRELLAPARSIDLARLTASDLWALEDKRPLALGALFGRASLQLTAAVRGIVVLQWQPARLGKTEAVRCSFADRPELAGLIAKRPGPFCRSGRHPVNGHAPGLVDLAPYLQQLAAVPVLELRGGVDFEAAAERCLELLA